MKARKFLYGAIAFMMLPACVNDMDDGSAPSSELMTNAKITINIMANGTLSRAETPYPDEDEFSLGNENEIKSAVIVFYDANKNPMTNIPVDGSKLSPNGNDPNNVELIKKVELDVNLADGQYPSWMMVYANPIDASDVDFPLTPQSISSKTRTTFMGTSNTFAMNNAVYFAEDGTLMREVAVSKDNFYQTDEEKTKAQEVKVYLERVAGKVTLKPKGASLGTQEGEIEGKKLVFTPISWGVNAVAKKFYLIKRFSYTEDVNDLNWLESTFSTFYVNDYQRHRSYWAVTPHYKFPLIENGSAVDATKYPYVTDDIDNVNNSLKYFSWNQFTGNVSEGTINRKIEIGSSTYTMENTVHSTMYNTQLADINKNAALVSAVVVGRYTVNGEEKDFYVHGGKIYLVEDYIKAMANYSSVIVHADGTPLNNEDKLNEIFEIKHPKKNLAGTNKDYVEENKVTIKLKEGQKNKLKYKKSGETEPVMITDANYNEVNETLQALCGLASAYTKGMAYFNVPIRHLGNRASDKDAWPAGSFGVVRNHSYVITVDGFAELSTETLGHGVLDPDDPIVPPSDPNDKFGLKAEIRVLSWRLVNQNVTLGK